MSIPANETYQQSVEIGRNKRTALASHYHRSHDYQRQARNAARDWGAADRSDPFAGRRALAMMRNGLAVPSDYHVEWDTEPREVVINGRRVRYNVNVPRNMKRP